MATANELLQQAKSLNNSFSEMNRKLTDHAWWLSVQSRRLRGAGKTAEADAAAKEAEGVEAELEKLSIDWTEAQKRVRSLLLKDDITDEIVAEITKARDAALGHLKRVRETAKKLDELRKFADFLAASLKTLRTVTSLVNPG